MVGAALVQAGAFEAEALLAGLPSGILTGLIVWVNQFPDAPGDKAGGKHTLVVRLGLLRSRWVYIFLWAASYASIIGLVIAETLPALALIGLASIPLALYVTRQLFLNIHSRDIKNAMVGTILLHLVTGLLIALGLGLEL